MNKCYCQHCFSKEELLEYYSQYSRHFNDDFFIKCPKCGKILPVETKVKDVDFKIKIEIGDRESF